MESERGMTMWMILTRSCYVKGSAITLRDNERRAFCLVSGDQVLCVYTRVGRRIAEQGGCELKKAFLLSWPAAFIRESPGCFVCMHRDAQFCNTVEYE